MHDEKIIVLVGCSSSLEIEFVKLAAASDSIKILVADEKKYLYRLSKISTEGERLALFELDITSEQSIYELINYAIGRWHRIDCLVNAISKCCWGAVEHMDTATESNLMQSNFLGPVALFRAVLPIMREQSGGQIVNMVTGVENMKVIGFSSYGASRVALDYYVGVLALEAKRYGIRVDRFRADRFLYNFLEIIHMPQKACLSALLGGPYSDLYHSPQYAGVNPSYNDKQRLRGTRRQAKNLYKLILGRPYVRSFGQRVSMLLQNF